MRNAAARLVFGLWLWLILALPGSAQTAADAFIYAAQDDGTLHVYDINDHHTEVKVISVFSCCADVRGITAAAPTHQLYVMYNRDGQGHVAALDLLTDQLAWDQVLHQPGVDRGNLTPDGSTLYLPTWEEDPDSAYELVIDAETGAEKGRITLPPRSHDTLVSLDGKRVFLETKSQTARLYVADTSSNTVTSELGGYCCSGVLAPFAINGAGTRVVNQVNDFAGFQLADVAVGGVTQSVRFASGYGGHGIAFTPDETEVWVNDGGTPFVHVFDMTMSPPRERQPVAVSNVSHWLTFSIDGRFAYVAGRKGAGDPTDVVDVSTRQRVNTLGPSEDLLEVDVAAGSVVAVGNQFGIGRKTSP
jgi:DNA-binding beta-propeller fold protein YncE